VNLYKPPKGATAALRQVTAEEKANILGTLEDKWTQRAVEIQQRLGEAVERGDHNEAQRWTWCAGVATDKIRDLKGRPPETIVHLHAHRHDLGPLFDRLASVRGVAHPQLAPTNSVTRVVDVAGAGSSDAAPTSPGARR